MLKCVGVLNGQVLSGMRSEICDGTHCINREGITH